MSLPGRLLAVCALAGALLLPGGCKGRQSGAEVDSVVAHAATSAVDYHRKLEPDGRVVLHGAGQTDDETFREYSLTMVERRPMLYMSYVDLKDDLASYFARLRHDVNLYPDYLVPQIGLSLNQGSAGGHYEDGVASGAVDKQLDALCAGLKGLERPVFLRVGYEFNAPWNGYAAESYVAAFRHVGAVLRGCHADAVAMVWDYAPESSGADPMKFYPGDDAVDWWGINLFEAADIDGAATARFLDAAAAHRFPVMIGEASPKGDPVSEGAKAVQRWYEPFFRLIHQYPQIKAFCYINWDWRKYPQWASWGDARIQDNPQVLRFYRAELSDALYQPAAGRAETLKLLHAERLVEGGGAGKAMSKEKGPAVKARPVKR